MPSVDVIRSDVNVGAIKSAGFPVIWVLGPPGCGKGTQCAEIGVKKGFLHLSSGDLLRDEVVSGSPRGMQLYKLMADGNLVPDEVVLDLIAETMVKTIYEGKMKGFVLDGFPADLAQAEAFEANIVPANKIIFLSVDDEVGQERLISRNNFDDKEESIKKRQKTFYEKTMPIFDKFGDKVVKVDANRTAEESYPDSLAAVASL